jgi:hypothetical protein
MAHSLFLLARIAVVYDSTVQLTVLHNDDGQLGVSCRLPVIEVLNITTTNNNKPEITGCKCRYW